MTDNINPYKPAKAGDLITSEIWNDVQVDIKKDIQSSIQDAKKEIKKEGVDKAIDADKFGEKTPEEWKKVLDNLYAPKVHSHEGQSVYRKYFNRFTQKTPAVFLKHNLGAFPLVDVYELKYVFDKDLDGIDQDAIDHVNLTSSDKKPTKFFLYFDSDERGRYGLYTSVFRDNVNLGIRIDKALEEFNVDWDEDDSLADVVVDLWDKLFAPPNDKISHAISPSILDKYEKPIKELIEYGEWDDIYLAFRPQKCTWVSCQQSRGEVNPNNLISSVPLKVTNVNYNTLLLEIDPNELPEDHVDIMTLLRI